MLPEKTALKQIFPVERSIKKGHVPGVRDHGARKSLHQKMIRESLPNEMACEVRPGHFEGLGAK